MLAPDKDLSLKTGNPEHEDCNVSDLEWEAHKDNPVGKERLIQARIENRNRMRELASAQQA